MNVEKVIYDFGSYNGDDIPYYLKKADKVVAVEANPILSDQIRRRFPRGIEEGRLILESAVLTAGGTSGDVYFYRHKQHDVMSQFLEPEKAIDAFEKIRLPARSVLDLIGEYGAPYYIKLDIEHYDEQILRALFESDIRPPFLSAEAHSVRIFAVLLDLGGYNAFKLVDGASIPRKYGTHSIATATGREQYSFSRHSAGPFGDDIDGDWMTADNFCRLLALHGLGWVDIHVTSQTAANPSAHARLMDFAMQSISKRLAHTFREVVGKVRPRS